MTTSRSPRILVLSLGSNLGDRLQHLRRAVSTISKSVEIVRISSVYETDPLDMPEGSTAFLNLIVVGQTRESADALMSRFGSIERSMGRRSSVRNAPRPIDIDLVCYGGELRRSGSVQLPHPRFHEREFVLAPLRELGVDWIDASSGMSVLEMRGRGEVRRAGPLY